MPPSPQAGRDGAKPKRSPFAIDRGRALRRAMTPQEVKLWVRLRALRGQGFHIRRQMPRDGYVLDFVCLDRRLIIEVDGMTHGGDADARRDDHFARLGFHTLRFSNQEIGANLDGVVETIYLALSAAETARLTRPR